MSDRPDLPDDVVARIDLTEAGVRFNLREGMPTSMVVDLLRTLADAFENGEIQQVMRPANGTGGS